MVIAMIEFAIAQSCQPTKSSIAIFENVIDVRDCEAEAGCHCVRTADMPVTITVSQEEPMLQSGCSRCLLRGKAMQARDVVEVLL